MLDKIILVVILCWIKDWGRRNDGDNRPWKDFFIAQFCNHRLCRCHLRIGVREDNGTVARAHIMTLVIKSSGIVNHKEDSENFPIRHDCWIKLDLHNLSMAGGF